MANKRGEVRIKLGGKDFTLRPSFAALQNIEDQTGLGILDISRRLMAGTAKFSHIAVIMWAGILASKPSDPPTLEAVGEMVLDEEKGFVGYFAPCRDLIVSLLTSGPKEPTPGEAPGVPA